MSRQDEIETKDIEDYILHNFVFSRLSTLYGRFDIDMFANATNTKCKSH